MGDALKAIVAAGGRNIDFLAFLSAVIISAMCLTSGVAITEVIALLVVVCLCWIIFRYALLRIQTHERLRDMQESASVKAKELIGRHATNVELDAFLDKETQDEVRDDEHN